MENILSPLYGFKNQFDFVPEIKNKEHLDTRRNIVICGMGGSAISVSLLQLLFPTLAVTLHNSYGLPSSYDTTNTLFILNSYSGNTEEILDAFERGNKEGVSLAVLSRGGTLIEQAKQSEKAYIELPESHLEPRFSIGHQMIGLLALMYENEKIEALRGRIELLHLETLEATGKQLAQKFEGKYPVIYSSENFHSVAYLIKAAINEGAKVPSFVNIIPEANHNELQSFVTDEETSESQRFAFLHIISSYDHIRIIKRLSVMEEIYKEQNFVVESIEGDHTNMLSIFELILTGYFMATFLALQKNINPYTTPLIQDFKKRMTH